MLITFKSKAAADVLMYEVHAKPLLDLLHKDVKRGIITAAESAGAISRLEAEIASHKAQAPAEDSDPDAEQEAREQGKPAQVSFSTRAFPLLDMLRAAQKGQHDVMWGV